MDRDGPKREARDAREDVVGSLGPDVRLARRVGGVNEFANGGLE